MATGESITFTLGKENYGTGTPFKEWDIIKSSGKPLFGERYDLVKKVESENSGQYTLTMHPLNISKWKWMRKLELYILRKCLNKTR